MRTLLEFNCEIQTKNSKGACTTQQSERAHVAHLCPVAPVDSARDNAELFDAIRQHMKKVPGGERKLRSTGEEHVIFATKLEVRASRSSRPRADLLRYVGRS